MTCYCSLLPETMVGNVSLLTFYSHHRQILADTLLRDRLDLDSTGKYSIVNL